MKNLTGFLGSILWISFVQLNLSFRNETWMNIEEHIRQTETSSFANAIKRLRERQFNLKGFFHTSDSGTFWKEVIREQLMLLDGKRSHLQFMESFQYGTSDFIEWDPRSFTSLLSEADSMEMKLSIGYSPHKNESHEYTKLLDFFYNEVNLTSRHKVQLKFNQTIFRHAKPHDRASLEKSYGGRLTCGEMSTIIDLNDYCTDLVKKEHHNGLIFYFHSKGSCCARSTQVPPHWREFMNTFNLEFPSVCINALLNGYSTCGVNYRPYNNHRGIPPHYSGNFWWARCDYIASLPAPTEAELFDAYAAEWFPMTVHPDFNQRRVYGESCAKNIHDSNVFFYHNYTRDCYIHLVKEALQKDILSPDTAEIITQREKQCIDVLNK